MLLAIDIGNTNIVFGVKNKNGWINSWRIQTDPQKMADEYEVIFRSLLTTGKVYQTDVEQIVVSSVVPSLVRTFTDMLKVISPNSKITLVGPEIYPKLPIKILNPYQNVNYEAQNS